MQWSQLLVQLVMLIYFPGQAEEAREKELQLKNELKKHQIDIPQGNGVI